MHVSVLIILLALSTAAALPAATVLIDYPGVRGTALGATLLEPLGFDGETPVADLDLGLERVVITWSGRKTPPTVRYIGLDAPALVARLMGDNSGVASPWGLAAELDSTSGYALAAAGPKEAVLATAKRMASLTLSELPAASPYLIEITAMPDDFKLGNAAKRIDQMHLHWGHNNRVRLTSHSASQDQATWVTSYVNRRLPWLRFADTLGIDDAEFPAKLLKGRKVKVKGTTATIDLDLSKQDLRDGAYANLDKLIDRQMRKYVGN